MKKIICILIALATCFALFGCAGGEKLTSDNYETYLKVTVPFNKEKIQTSSKTKSFYQGTSGTVSVEGVSSNYDYKDVEIVFTIYAIEHFDESHNQIDIKEPETRTMTQDVTVKLNIAGDGEAPFYIKFDNFWRDTKFTTYADWADDDPVKYASSYPYEADVYYEIKSIKGTVSK